MFPAVRRARRAGSAVVPELETSEPVRPRHRDKSSASLRRRVKCSAFALHSGCSERGRAIEAQPDPARTWFVSLPACSSSAPWCSGSAPGPFPGWPWSAFRSFRMPPRLSAVVIARAGRSRWRHRRLGLVEAQPARRLTASDLRGCAEPHDNPTIEPTGPVEA